jgi:hypothetical protein
VDYVLIACKFRQAQIQQNSGFPNIEHMALDDKAARPTTPLRKIYADLLVFPEMNLTVTVRHAATSTRYSVCGRADWAIGSGTVQGWVTSSPPMYIRSCVTSRRHAIGQMHPQRNLSPLAFDNIAIDIFSLPLSGGYDACLAIVDTFTKAVILQPTRTTASTEDVAEMLFTSVMCKGFLASTIISDRDSKYISELWSAVMSKMGTKIQLTTPYHQQADPAERTIQTVQTVLRCYNDVDWVKRLSYVELALNDMKNESTGYSPNELLYVARRGPVVDRLADEDDGFEQFPELLAQAKQRTREAMDNIKLAQGKQKLQYDHRHRALDEVKAGDHAFLLLDKHDVRGIKHNKLTWPKWGAFKVLEVRETEVDLEFPPTSRKHPTVSRQHIEVLPADDFDRGLPEPDLIEGEEAWEVESIIGERLYGRTKQQQFHVKWRDWPINQSTWEPEDRLKTDMDADTLDKIRDYREATNNSLKRARNTLRTAGSTARAMAVVEAREREKEPVPESKPRERPILYLSRTLRSYERNYTILELELGAVVWSVLKLQRYLDGVPFTVVTDHQPILQVVSSSSRTITSPRVERWRMLLQPYMGQMTFVHKAGKRHLNVDALSRLPRGESRDGIKEKSQETKMWTVDGASMGREGIRRRKVVLTGTPIFSRRGM